MTQWTISFSSRKNAKAEMICLIIVRISDKSAGFSLLQNSKNRIKSFCAFSDIIISLVAATINRKCLDLEAAIRIDLKD